MSVSPRQKITESPSQIPTSPRVDSPEFDRWIRDVKQQMIASLRRREGR